jgi:hypothetical protein
MRFSPSISTLVFDELLTTLEMIGVENTIKTLKEAKKKNAFTNIDFVVNTVSDVTNVDRDRILYGTDRSDERKMALSLAIYFVKIEFSYGYSDLKKIFNNKDRAALSRYYNMVSNLPATPKSDIDKKLKAYHKKISFFINEKKIKK